MAESLTLQTVVYGIALIASWRVGSNTATSQQWRSFSLGSVHFTGVREPPASDLGERYSNHRIVISRILERNVHEIVFP